MTASGLTLEGKDVLVIEGHSSITGEPAKVKLTDYGFEFFGDITEKKVHELQTKLNELGRIIGGLQKHFINNR